MKIVRVGAWVLWALFDGAADALEGAGGILHKAAAGWLLLAEGYVPEELRSAVAGTAGRHEPAPKKKPMERNWKGPEDARDG
jgi:hypothetical protein